MEIERKFRLLELPWVAVDGGEEILQGYLVTEHGELRLRRRGSDCFITVKGDGTISREEWEKEIPEWVFTQLWPSTSGRSLEKTRYTIYHNGAKVEVDVYRSALQGLLTFECEFESEEEANKFQFPDWAHGAVEVTEDMAYKNKNLAIKGLPKGA